MQKDPMDRLSLHSLFRYPIKSLAGESLTHATTTARGLLHDRRWMLIDHQGQFITQRVHPRLALLRVEVQGDEQNHRLSVHFPSGETIRFASEHMNSARQVTIWADTVPAVAANTELNTALSDYLGLSAQLVFMPEHSKRQIDPTYAAPGQFVSFADGFPILVTTTASLQAVSTLCHRPLDMRRFRPNVVIDGAQAWQEESWRKLRIGSMELDLVKPCTRCILTTVDPNTGVADPDRVPLLPMSKQKRGHAGVVFGMNALVTKAGECTVHDPVQVLA